MRIVSEFKDYYDSGMAMGMDTELVYVRTSSVVKLKDGPDLPRTSLPTIRRPGISLMPRYLGICGKLYTYYQVSYVSKDSIYKKGFVHKERDLEQLKKDLARRELTTLDQLLTTKPTWYGHYISPKVIEGVPEEISNEIFHYYKVPILLYPPEAYSNTRLSISGTLSSNPVLILNPCLREDSGLNRVVNAFTLYQEISMFLGGVLGSIERESFPRSDLEIRNSHGFGNESFKTASPGKKSNRRSKRSGTTNK